MKRNFTWSTRAIDLHSNSAFLSRLKFWFAKKLKMNLLLPRQKRAFANYWDHAKILVVFKRWCNSLILCESCCWHNWPTLRGEKLANDNLTLFFNWRLLEIRVCKKVLLKEKILEHYQNCRFFRTFTNSNKMSGLLHVRINGCILYIFNVDNPSFALFSF